MTRCRSGLPAMALSLLLAGMLAGCFSSGNAPLRTEVIRPVPAAAAEAVSNVALGRNLPWSARSESLLVTEPFEMPQPADAELSPGLAAGRQLLLLRDRGRAELRVALGALPAAEPPPGEAAVLSVAQLAERHASLATAWGAAVASATEERGITPEGVQELRLTVSLAPLSEAVLAVGGGFRSDSALGSAFTAEGRAEREAAAAAREELIRELLSRRVKGQFTYRDWVALNALNRRQFEAAATMIQITESVAAPTADGSEGWRVALEFDPAPLRREALKDYDVWKRRQREELP